MDAQVNLKAVDKACRVAIEFAPHISKAQAGKLTFELSKFITGFKCETDFALKVPVNDNASAHHRYFLLERAEIYKREAQALLGALSVLEAINAEEHKRLLALLDKPLDAPLLEPLPD